MAHDLCQNLVSAKYLENKLTEFTKFMSAFILTRTRWEVLPVIFCLFESCPVSEFSSCSMSLDFPAYL